MNGPLIPALALVSLSFTCGASFGADHSVSPGQAPDESSANRSHPETSSQPLARRLDKVLTTKIHRSSIVGLCAAVTVDGKPVFLRSYGYADREEKIPVKPDTIFALASITKVFTAVAVLTLADEGRLKTSDRVCSHLNKFPRDWDDVRIQHLLTHTSGVPVSTRTNRPWSGQFNEISGGQRRFRAGERAEYNNIAYMIAGLVVEHAAGIPLSKFFRDRIFLPLGMDNGRIPSDLFPRGLAKGYRLRRGSVDQYKNYQPWIKMGGSAGVVSSVTDLIRFEKSLCNQKLLSSEALDKMSRPVLLKNGAPGGWTYGWEVVNSPAGVLFRKNGNIGGYSSWYSRTAKEKVAVIILSNTGDCKFEDVDEEIRRALRKTQ